MPEPAASTPTHHGHRQRLRERFLRSGLEGFADYEVVELLLTLAIPRSDVKQPAKALIARFGSLRGILDAPLEALREVSGLGEVAPVALRIVKAAATLYLRQEAEERESLADPARLADFWRLRIGALPNEVFEVAYLDSGYRLLRDGVETLQQGTIDRAAVYPRRVVEAALRRGAAALVLAHNHPNGRVEPSEQDELLTRALNLLVTGQAEPKELVLCTFTEKAAFEMRDRQSLRGGVWELIKSFWDGVPLADTYRIKLMARRAQREDPGLPQGQEYCSRRLLRSRRRAI